MRHFGAFASQIVRTFSEKVASFSQFVRPFPGVRPVLAHFAATAVARIPAWALLWHRYGPDGLYGLDGRRLSAEFVAKLPHRLDELGLGRVVVDLVAQHEEAALRRPWLAAILGPNSDRRHAVTEAIISLSEFKADASQWLKQLQEGGQAVVSAIETLRAPPVKAVLAPVLKSSPIRTPESSS